MTTDADAMVILANSIDNLAEAIRASQVSPGGSTASPPPAGPPSQPGSLGAPSGPPGGPPPKGEKTLQQKRGGLIWGVAKDHGTDVTSVAVSVGLGGLSPDARSWSDADQQAVLDAYKKWNWIEDNR